MGSKAGRAHAGAVGAAEEHPIAHRPRRIAARSRRADGPRASERGRPLELSCRSRAPFIGSRLTLLVRRLDHEDAAGRRGREARARGDALARERLHIAQRRRLCVFGGVCVPRSLSLCVRGGASLAGCGWRWVLRWVVVVRKRGCVSVMPRGRGRRRRDDAARQHPATLEPPRPRHRRENPDPLQSPQHTCINHQRPLPSVDANPTSNSHAHHHSARRRPRPRPDRHHSRRAISPLHASVPSARPLNRARPTQQARDAPAALPLTEPRVNRANREDRGGEQQGRAAAAAAAGSRGCCCCSAPVRARDCATWRRPTATSSDWAVWARGVARAGGLSRDGRDDEWLREE